MSIATSIYNDKVFNGTFGANLQKLIDGTLPALYQNSTWRNYLTWAPTQTALTFDTVIGRKRIEAAASIVDINSPAPLRSRAKLESLTGKIPTMKEKFRLDQNDYRAIQELKERNNLGPDELKNALLDLIYNDVENAVASPDRRLDVMFYQSVSTFTVDTGVLSNPDGVNYGTIDLLAKADQKRTVSQVWSNIAADPFADIDAVVNYAASTGRSFAEIWIDRATWLQIKNYDKVKTALLAYGNPGSNKNFIVTLDSVNEFLVASGYPPFKIINERRGIETDGVITTINPFKKENVVFMPAGKLGRVYNAWATESREPVPGYVYANYDKTLLKKYRSSDPWTEWTEVELNAFPAIEAIDGIFILQTDVVTP